MYLSIANDSIVLSLSIMKTIILALTCFLLASCSTLNKNVTKKDQFILFQETSDKLKGEITVVLKNSSKLKCDESNLIGVRIDGQINKDLSAWYTGCVALASQEIGYLKVKPICTDHNSIHELTIKIRRENKEYEELITFDLNKVL